MTEAVTAQCRWASRDYIKAYICGDSVHFDAFSNDKHEADSALRPNEVREFARGILALADEIDGGEAKAEAPKPAPKVGDRVRVVRNAYVGDGAANVGNVGRLARTDIYDDKCQYRVELDGIGWWCAEVELVDAPAEAPADTRPKVGDRVRVVFAKHAEEHHGSLGTVNLDHGRVAAQSWRHPPVPREGRRPPL
ncbi:hypothetical protein M2271_003594 [Streptomyces sp. LBL]|uniref:hypothetical protein n=1 Tax=Streptomyces sp. LBL TaxID=2940562 RepID=UPI002475528F|nr:hypothetical protein [Streptomyces sp. LBL]MDH6625783.1 hypothetical protein [Streptomyces sp. LBL]